MPRAEDAPPVEFAMGVSFRLGAFAETARLVEDAGFDRIACGEHVLFRGPTPNAFVVLAHAAGVTTRVRLLSAITLVPLYPPALLAKLGAVLDLVSGGRFDLGVGVGGEHPAEFEACGVPVRERGTRTDEALAVVAALWSGAPVTMDGRFGSLDGAVLDPPPVQPGGPPVWVAGRSEVAMRRAVRWGDVWMPYMYTPGQVAESVARVAELAAEAGRPATEIRTHVNCFITVDDDGDRARRTASEHVGAVYGQDFSGRRAAYLVAGTPDECAERLAAYVEAGADGVVFSAIAAPDAIDEVIRRTGEEVVPAVRERFSGGAAV